MPIYEYYCQPCNGIFEEIRPMREASDPVPCPQCYADARRIPPTSFNAFTFRDGYPRRIPDDGKYWHLGEKVNNPITGGVRANEHPELLEPEVKPKLSKGDKEVSKDKQLRADREKAYRKKEGAPEIISG